MLTFNIECAFHAKILAPLIKSTTGTLVLPLSTLRSTSKDFMIVIDNRSKSTLDL